MKINIAKPPHHRRSLNADKVSDYKQFRRALSVLDPYGLHFNCDVNRAAENPQPSIANQFRPQ
jgi:hypothetical protein